MVEAALKLVEYLIANNISITTAESCSGGLVAAAITDIPGASAIFRQGIISYANSAKTTLLDVSAASISKYGAVSEIVAKEMAEGARNLAKADLAIAITGIAGPSGGTPEKPVGLVFIALANARQTIVEKHIFGGDREAIRKQATEKSLIIALKTAEKQIAAT